MIIALVLSLLPYAAFSPQNASAQLNTGEDEVVFIDSNGQIRVWDPNVPDGATKVNWSSPGGGYRDLALGDVNSDGDQEIVATYWDGATGKVVVIDPVLNSRSLTEDGEVDGIPWKILAEIPVPGEPTLIATGELDTGVNGDEIVYGYETGTSSVMVVLKGTAVSHDGTSWSEHIRANLAETWDKIAVGNANESINGSGPDEIIVTREGDGTKDDKSLIHIYRVDTDSLAADAEVFRRSSSSAKWRGVAIGEMKKGGPPEVVAYRSVTGVDARTVFLFQHDPNETNKSVTWDEAEGDAIEMLRRPHWAFMVDLNGSVNGVQDFEAFFIREVKANESADKKRLLVVNRGDDSVDTDRTSLRLDLDSNWRRGVGANINGSPDGREAVVLMAVGKLRYYRYDPSQGTHLIQTDEWVIGTNQKSLQAGDLDAIGFTSGIELSLEVSAVELLSGDGQRTVSATISASDDGVPVNVQIDTSSDFVLSANPSGALVTPVTYFINVDASNLLPDTYSIPISVSSSNSEVINSPLSSAIPVDVVPATVTVSPSSATHVQFPCTGEAVDEEISLVIRGSTGINYTAVVIEQPEIQEIENMLAGTNRSGMVNAAGMVEITDEYGNLALLEALATPAITGTNVITWASPDWLDVVSMKGTIDKSGTSSIPGPTDSVTVTVKASQLPEGTISAEAMLILVTDQRTGASPDNLQYIPISYLCASAEISLPLVYPGQIVVR